MSEHGEPIRVTLSLQGECCRCGRCCSAVLNGCFAVCEHLRYDDVAAVEAGSDQASWCAKYTERYDGMPVAMKLVDGTVVDTYCCWIGSLGETRAIVARGIGCGCSLGMQITEVT